MSALPHFEVLKAHSALCIFARLYMDFSLSFLSLVNSNEDRWFDTEFCQNFP